MLGEQSTITAHTVLEKIYNLDRELRFLWQDANDSEHLPEIKVRKIKQFWDIYRLYRKQKDFLKAMIEHEKP